MGWIWRGESEKEIPQLKLSFRSATLRPFRAIVNKSSKLHPNSSPSGRDGTASWKATGSRFGHPFSIRQKLSEFAVELGALLRVDVHSGDEVRHYEVEQLKKFDPWFHDGDVIEPILRKDGDGNKPLCGFLRPFAALAISKTVRASGRSR